MKKIFKKIINRLVLDSLILIFLTTSTLIGLFTINYLLLIISLFITICLMFMDNFLSEFDDDDKKKKKEVEKEILKNGSLAIINRGSPLEEVVIILGYIEVSDEYCVISSKDNTRFMTSSKFVSYNKVSEYVSSTF